MSFRVLLLLNYWFNLSKCQKIKSFSLIIWYAQEITPIAFIIFDKQDFMIRRQASLLSNSIFYCGWHLCPSQFTQRRNLGRLVLQACAQAQRPLIMKAFKMLELTYGTFLLVWMLWKISFIYTFLYILYVFFFLFRWLEELILFLHYFMHNINSFMGHFHLYF